MNNLITEDIIKNALNESIEDFILEEAWGSGLKKWWNGSNGQKIRNVGNSLLNGVRMYMDWRTNGQWNQKYGQYVNGNGKTAEMYYLNKWFNYHLGEIQKIAYYTQNPNRAQGEIEWKYNEKGEKVGTQKINNYNDIKDYVIKNIHPYNFNNWIKNYITDRNSLECIDNYISKCNKSITNYKTALQFLNTGAFLSDEYGKEFLSNSRKQLYRNQIQNGYNKQQQTNPVGNKDINYNNGGVIDLKTGKPFKSN